MIARRAAACPSSRMGALVVPRLPGEARADQEHVITPEQARGDRRRPRGLDQPRLGRADRGDPAKSSAERNRAATKDNEPGHQAVPGYASLAAAEPSWLRGFPLPRPREPQPRHEPHVVTVTARIDVCDRRGIARPG